VLTAGDENSMQCVLLSNILIIIIRLDNYT